MRRTNDAATRDLWQGFGDAWTLVSELVTATALVAAAGYGLDRLLGTWPILFAIGAVAGNATGVFILYRRTIEAIEREKRGR